MIIDYNTRTIAIKLVFYGPAMSGKTTSIRWLFSLFDHAEQLTSIENTVGRTMFCDFGTIPLTMANGWTITANIWSATGQDFYRSTREVVLVGADGIVFVADSQPHLLDENLASWNELMAMVLGQDRELPVVVCLNKVDLEPSIDEETLRNHLRIPQAVPVFRSIARDGFNIFESFGVLFQQAMRARLMIQSYSE